jgi:hypothetical protein
VSTASRAAIPVAAHRAKLEAISEAQALGTMTTAVRALTHARGAASAECRRSEDSVGRCCGRIYRLKVAIHWREHLLVTTVVIMYDRVRQRKQRRKSEECDPNNPLTRGR